jgi:hypothetical protein
VFASSAGAVTRTVLVTGDIAACGSTGAARTADIVRAWPNSTLITVGDMAYPDGTRWEFDNCYGPRYGEFWGRTQPSVGNHEFNVPDANGYFGYFAGKDVGDYGKGWYATWVGDWRVYHLNSNCWLYGWQACGWQSEQYQWLAADLARTRPRCTMAAWHHPQKSSTGRESADMDEILWLLAAYDLDVLVNGHAHLYERFKLMTPNRQWIASGFRSFIVGTGGAGLHPITRPLGLSAARSDTTNGVLKFVLTANGFTWNFLPVAGANFTDSGTGGC